MNEIQLIEDENQTIIVNGHILNGYMILITNDEALTIYKTL